MRETASCGWTVGPVWKADGEVCRCILPPDHHGTPFGDDLATHLCSCGAWFADCGRARDEVRA